MPSEKVQAYPVYGLRISVQRPARVTVIQRMDGRIVFQGTVAPPAPQECLAQGPLEVRSPELGAVAVQIGNNRYWVSDPNAQSFKIESAPEMRADRQKR